MKAWSVLIPLFFAVIGLMLIEFALNRFFIFYYEKNMTTTICWFLILMALSWTVVLLLGDKIKFDWFGTLISVFLVFLLIGGWGILSGGWPSISRGVLIVKFIFSTLIFLTGLGGSMWLLRIMAGKRFIKWFTIYCFFVGIVPFIICAWIGHVYFDGSSESAEFLRALTYPSVFIFAPYLVMSPFLVFTLWNPFYRQKFKLLDKVST